MFIRKSCLKLSVFLLACCSYMLAAGQNNVEISRYLDISAKTGVTFSSGLNAPFWLTANRQGLSSISNNNCKLDYQWRLNSIEYKSGTDFDRNDCTTDFCKGKVYYNFAQDIVEIDYHPDSSTYRIMVGMCIERSDTLIIDFSMYNEEHQTNPNFVPNGADHSIRIPSEILKNIRKCGMETLRESFGIDILDNKKMELSNSKVVLSFDKW